MATSLSNKPLTQNNSAQVCRSGASDFGFVMLVLDNLLSIEAILIRWKVKQLAFPEGFSNDKWHLSVRTSSWKWYLLKW